MEIENNIYEIVSGTHTLTKYDGNTLTMNILSPIVKSMACDYISEGVLQVEGGLLNGDINYGETASTKN
jgi:hypothetical protein